MIHPDKLGHKRDRTINLSPIVNLCLVDEILNGVIDDKVGKEQQCCVDYLAMSRHRDLLQQKRGNEVRKILHTSFLNYLNKQEKVIFF